jgi:2-C-methyl-D-erythritol 4-phosphate cytidylyltransferase
MTAGARLFALVPAAGGGSRFNAGRESAAPKQYALVNGAPMLRHAVEALLAERRIETVFVVLAPDDTQFGTFDWAQYGSRVAPLYCGGPSRRDSVLNGLIAAASELEPDDWVLVHDAARPCLARADLARLIEAAEHRAQSRVPAEADAGAILAVRVADTLKRGDDTNAIVATEPRDGLWQAQTPQMFRYGVLLRTLRAAAHVTDEASAVERAGLHPLLVEGSARNLKVTYPSDLELAALILSSDKGSRA